MDFDLGGRTARILYTSESRVDYRALFRDLCRDLRMRVTMCRLGPRDLAKRTGTCGPCGRALCCKSFLADFPPVAVKMVKAQQFPLTPDRSAGMCRRLKCCLTFSRDQPTVPLADTQPGLERSLARADGLPGYE
ncbi:MAG: hypothetical protein HY713_10905 [candidate division NC10 bacterium]|nr:hypothetical protein [candidate division NC10 bacterium]